MHNRFVRFVLKVAVPTTLKVWSRPLLHLLQFLLSRPNLDTSFNSISCERASALDVPFVEDCFLDFWDSADEVVEALGVYFISTQWLRL